MKYIDADKLIAKIWEICDYASEHWDVEEERGVSKFARRLTDFIASLEQERSGLPGIEDPGIPGKDYIPVEWVDACERYGKWKIIKEQPEVDLEKEIEKYFSKWVQGASDEGCFNADSQLISIYDCHRIACHFYELGCRNKKV